jgi:hypothetical protein
MNFKHLTPEQREAWGELFAHYVFDPKGEASAHIPEARRGVLGPISPGRAKEIRAFLVEKLKT